MQSLFRTLFKTCNQLELETSRAGIIEDNDVYAGFMNGLMQHLEEQFDKKSEIKEREPRSKKKIAMNVYTEYDVKGLIIFGCVMTAYMWGIIFYFFLHVLGQVEVKQSVTTNDNGNKASASICQVISVRRTRINLFIRANQGNSPATACIFMFLELVSRSLSVTYCFWFIFLAP
jgi:hypothetical protein